jgi:hypothetical protein
MTREYRERSGSYFWRPPVPPEGGTPAWLIESLSPYQPDKKRRIEGDGRFPSTILCSKARMPLQHVEGHYEG